MYKNRFLKLNMGIFEPPDHHNLDATDLTSQAVSRKVECIQGKLKGHLAHKVQVEADVIQTGNQSQF